MDTDEKTEDAILEVSALSKVFAGVTAVNDVSLTVAKGEIFGFLGPNGAGKTTTINMLTGLTRPSSGSFTIAGIDGHKSIKAVQQRIGIVPDESNLYDDLSGMENLTFCGSLYGLAKRTREERAARLLAQFDLASTGPRPFRAYSKGMKRKLTIAAGIIHQPEILFLDEPTTGIDVESARQIRKLILDLNQNGTTIFLTTHYIEEAERLCHRIGFIVRGSIVRLAKTVDLLREAGKEHSIEIVLSTDLGSVEKQLREEFPAFSIQGLAGKKVRIAGPGKIDLMPFMTFFDSRGYVVEEAKRARPALEDVFVKITGIEAQAMHGHEQGRGNKK